MLTYKSLDIMLILLLISLNYYYFIIRVNKKLSKYYSFFCKKYINLGAIKISNKNKKNFLNNWNFV